MEFDLDKSDIEPDAAAVAYDEAMLRLAVGQPSVVDSPATRVLPLNIRQRPNKYWALCRGPVYLQTTGTRDREKAEKKLRLAQLQEMAELRGLVDLQQADLIKVCDKYEKLTRYRRRLRKAKRAINIRHGLQRLRPHIEGLRVGQLDNERVDAIVEKLEAEGYKYGTIVNSFDHLVTAIRAWAKKSVECVLPFDQLPRAAGRTRVIEAHEQARALRWARGDETYDRATDTWSPPRRPLSAKERHRRSQFERMFVLGMATGSRPGRWDQLGWGPNYVCGWIDIAGCTMFRLPLGADPDLLKEAPPVLLSASTMAMVRQWRAEDAPDQPWVIRTFEGRSSARAAEGVFVRACRHLGLVGVTRHTVRHSMISGCVARGVPVEPLSRTAGVSPWVLRHRYNHSDARSVQPLAHAAIDDLLAEGIPVIHAGRPPNA